MAPRQRSFFDQDNTAAYRRKPQWQSNRSDTSKDQRHIGQPIPQKPHIPPSTQAREKLQAFAFHKSQDSVMVNIAAQAQGADKENIEPGLNTRNSLSSHKSAFRTELPPHESSHLKTPKHVRQTNPPETPGISLEDLLNDPNDREVSPPQSTPKDQVGWEDTRLRSSQIGPITPSIQRGKKRSRSESPTSSDRALGGEDGRDQKRQNPPIWPSKSPIKTPQYEPGRELWNRYTRHNLTTPCRPSASALAEVVPSSPQEPFTSASRTYRRVISDLTHTSRKRRKLDRERFGRNSQFEEVTSSAAAAAARVKVPMLLEKLREVTGVTAPALERKSSSSSPLPSETAQHNDVPITSQQLAELAMSDEVNGEGSDLNSTHYKATVEEAHDENNPSSDGQYGVSTNNENVKVLPDLAISTSEHGFSDFDIGEDDLLGTCLVAEGRGTSAEDRDQSDRWVRQASLTRQTQHVSPNFNRIGTGAATEAIGHEIPAPPQQDRASTTANSDSFGFDEFDDDEIAEMDLEMSKYTQTMDTGQQSRDGRKEKITRESRISSTLPNVDTTAYHETSIAPSGERSNPVDLVEEEFADEDFDNAMAGFTEFEVADTAVESSIPQSHSKPRTIQRYLVKTIFESWNEVGVPQRQLEKTLSVEDERTKLLKTVILRGFWVESPCASGSYVHVIADFDKTGQCIIDNKQGIIILHPDHLISATVVADSFKCVRRAVLQDRIKATNDANEAQVYGHIIHEIFQEALRANRWDDAWLDKTITEIAQRYLESLFEINIDLNIAINHLKDKAAKLKTWAEVFLLAKPGPRSSVKDRNGGRATLSVNKLLDTEEHVWSPMYGLKGNIDATVQVLTRDAEGDRTLTVPLELKTGKNTSNESHRAQTTLYTLLLSDRYDIEVQYGVLYYLEASEMSRIPSIRIELIHMIKQRNELAAYLRNRFELPPMLRKKRDCERCYAQAACFTYHKLSEDGNGETSGMKDDFVKKTQHLLPAHQDFFKKWDKLLTQEESDMMKFRRELWTMTSKERQKVGRCFSKVVIIPESSSEIPNAQKINRFKYSFSKQDFTAFFSFTESQLTVGDPIVVSDEQGHYALANGYVTGIRKDRISVAVDRRLNSARRRTADFEARKNQSFEGIMDVRQAVHPGQDDQNADPFVYRIDKDEFSNGMATVRNNLVRMMESGLSGAEKLRRLIVDKAEPIFYEKPPVPQTLSSQTELNVDQRAAIEKVMTAKDYALVLGMPGTGKTTTIAHIIRALASQGKSVLLTSYTHTAVDNILLKIKADRISTLRIGATTKVHPEVAEFADLAAEPKTSIEELEKTYNSQVVATTCLGINHPIFSQKTFDYCIVDEASQITLPVCLGPIRMAKTFILVGDHYQLPPLVQNREALEGGLDVSLFKYLSDAHPKSVVTLEHQYRMCAEIMSLSNELIYNGRLKCGNEAVAKRRVGIPGLEKLSAHHHTPITLPKSQTTFCRGPVHGNCWLLDSIRPACPVIFLNTDPLGDIAKEQATGSRIVNQVEVTLTTQLVTSLLSVGIDAHDIGVITLYRSQLALMRQELKARPTLGSLASVSTSLSAEVEMHTADKYQGRDKEVIVLSLVRSNDAYNVGDLLKDWRRVNVALTRARTKLIIVGSWRTMENGNELLNRFCSFVERQGWRHDLKKGVCQDHLFEDFAVHGSTLRADSYEQHIEDNKGKEVEKSSQYKKVDLSRGDNKENVPSEKSKQRQPEKRGRLNPGKIIGRRPVMMNVLKETLSAAEQELIGR